MAKFLWIALILQIVLVISSPVPDSSEEIEVPLDAQPRHREPLLTFDKGTVGVNFLGYRASAGLGGLLTGNAADGGLHAEAGTPEGQSAGAGLGGIIDRLGNRAGYKYSYANKGFA